MIRKNILYIFSAHFLLVFLIQIENALLFYKVPLWKLLTGQFENLLVSGILAGLYYFSRKDKLARVAFFSFYFFLLIFISMNQIFFQIFHENFAFTFADGFKLSDTSNYWGSFTGELRPIHFINTFYILSTAILFSRKDWFSDEQLKMKKEALIFPILLAITLPIQLFTAHSEVNRHLLFTLFRGVNVIAPQKVAISRISPEKLYKLKYGSPINSIEASPEENLQIVRNKKNIIFIVLESVGSMQVYKDNKINKEHFPYLAKNSKHIFSFPYLHNNFPGTTRSHIPIITGGKTITWGSVFKELLFPYTGPTLASEFKRAGKKTALISAMGLDFENLASFYNNLGFDYVYDSDRETKEFKKKNRVHSWGVDEKVALKRFDTWMEKNKNQPFFLQLLTNTTHHPYGAPKEFNHGINGTDSHSNYKKSLRYTDHIIKSLVERLKKQNLLKDTIIYISGDHGEAFGKFHDNNFAHKSSVYEETIRNFLLIYSPTEELKGVYSKRRGSLADIMPTLINPYFEKPIKGLLGQSLYSKNFTEKLAYFHKNTHPEIWGVRDGQWKYFAEKVGGANAKLFNLVKDPTEQNNLILKYPERSKDYQSLIANWFVQTNDAFVKELKGYEYLGDAGLSLTDVNSYGPKRMAIGVKLKGLNFKPLKQIHPEESLTVWSHGVSYPKDTTLRYQFTSPKGKKNGFTFKHKSDWSTVYVYDRPKKPREPGVWRATIYDLKGNEILSTLYKVSSSEKLHWSSVKKKPGLRKLSFGIKKKKQDFQELEVINPKEHMAVFSLGIPYIASKKFVYEWVSPSGKIRTFNFKIKSGWHSAWVYHDQKSPMEEGQWTLNIKEDQKIVITANFKVDSNAPLHIPMKF